MSDTASRRRPSGQLVLSVVGALVGLGFAVGLFLVLGPDTSAAVQARGFVVDSDRQVTVEFELSRDPGEPATCLVRARGASGLEVGREQFDVAPAQRRSVVVRQPLATTARATTGELVGCRLGTADDERDVPAP